jgi:hypothetical protein
VWVQGLGLHFGFGFDFDFGFGLGRAGKRWLLEIGKLSGINVLIVMRNWLSSEARNVRGADHWQPGEIPGIA